jgi:prepilin-type N-terminal cleavage/methylation domain-containing protein
MAKTPIKQQKGFTLIELLIVIGILAVLLAITIVAINPARQFAKANNSARLAHINSILNAGGQCFAENRGAYIGVGCDAIGQMNGTGSTVYTIQAVAGQTTTGTTVFSGSNVNLCGLVAGGYIAALPKDSAVTAPGAAADSTNCGATITTATAYNTGYTISKNAANKITVAAPLTDTANDSSLNGVALSVTR